MFLNSDMSQSWRPPPRRLLRDGVGGGPTGGAWNELGLNLDVPALLFTPGPMVGYTYARLQPIHQAL